MLCCANSLSTCSVSSRGWLEKTLQAQAEAMSEVQDQLVPRRWQRGPRRRGRGGGGAGARFIVYWTRCSATALVDTPLAAAWSREILPLYPLIDSVSRSCRGGDEKRRSFLVAFALLRGASLFDVACSFLSLVVRQGSRLPTEATLLLSAACG